MDVKKSAFQTPITIKEVIESIYTKKYLLPAIQREFVWGPEKIIRLFDSLMRDYTIGSFLLWNVDKDKSKEFQFYEFITKYHERDYTHNPKADITGKDDITAILDGQQRLTALYIGIKGSYSYKIPRKRWENDDAFPKRKLFINLLSKSDEFDLEYNFSFLTKEEATKKDAETFWFEISKIVEFESLRDINKFLRDNGLIECQFAEECLFKLYQVITEDRVINYYLETSQKLDKVLNIFIRVNSGGTELNYSDLLLSIATAQWKTKDAREEITSFVDEINRIGEGFEFNKDFVLKSCLVLSDLDIAFKVDNFNATNMNKIEIKWEKITKSLRITMDLISTFGYNSKNLTSNNAVIPISYYILKLGNPENLANSSVYKNDRDIIKKWFTFSLIKRVFSGQPDNVLRPIRKIIRDDHKVFPFNAIANHFKGTNKSLVFSDDDIQNLLYSKYGQSHTFSILSLLYPTLDFRNRFHTDHMFPRSFFKKAKLIKEGISENKHEFYLENYDYIGNLQLLEGLPNEEKSDKDFEEWFDETFKDEEEIKDYKKKHYIPKSISLEFGNFEEFFEERNKLIEERLNKILS